jgi:hypothetical protein
MLLSTANTAAPLALSIDVLNAQIAQINNSITNNAIISGGSLIVGDPISGTLTQNLQTLTVAESNVVFNSMLTILNSRLTAANAALTSL